MKSNWITVLLAFVLGVTFMYIYNGCNKKKSFTTENDVPSKEDNIFQE
jgi:hypothetical protein